MAYVSLVAFKAALDITETARDAELSRLLEAASQAIDRWGSLPDGAFTPTTATRYFDVTMGDAEHQTVLIPPIISVTTLKTDPTGAGTFSETWTATTDYLLYPLNGPVYTEIRTTAATGRYALPAGQRRLQIVGSWGEHTEVPVMIEEAVILQASRWRSRSKSPEGVMGNADVGFVKLASLDPDVAAILERGRFRRPEVFA